MNSENTNLNPEIITNRALVVQAEEKDDNLFREFLEIDKKIFPDMEIEESELRESFQSDGIQIVLRDQESKLIGYLISVPYEQAIGFLQDEDVHLVPKENTLYVETIGILQEQRQLKNVLDIWNSLKAEAIRKGFKTINGHFRVSEGLSSVVQKRLNGKYFRTLENWADFGESFDYIEIDLATDNEGQN